MDKAQQAAQEAVKAERKSAQTIELGGHRITLIVSVVAFVAFLILPYAGDAHGWEDLMLGTTSEGVDISIMEVISAWFALVGVGVLTTAVIIFRRTNLALVAWMLTTISFFLNLWGFWFRRASADGPSIGWALGMLASLLAFVVYSQVALRRSPEQLAAQQRVRETAGELDQIGVLQSEAATSLPAEENPLLVDDRRARAAQRHHEPRAQRQDEPGA
ncbi:hypothetical protein [Corynebacterium sp.]|uniref:Rv2732c family membrane protein n=1 Tax=Corynebacterium sp. TaxID=1720 RepID=UPI0026DB3B40|nr:hypothetical protein [Corynebacterium sp.]MDO5031676.1 hypothetical protein [Corynebacterium sp.]